MCIWVINRIDFIWPSSIRSCQIIEPKLQFIRFLIFYKLTIFMSRYRTLFCGFWSPFCSCRIKSAQYYLKCEVLLQHGAAGWSCRQWWHRSRYLSQESSGPKLSSQAFFSLSPLLWTSSLLQLYLQLYHPLYCPLYRSHYHPLYQPFFPPLIQSLFRPLYPPLLSSSSASVTGCSGDFPSRWSSPPVCWPWLIASDHFTWCLAEN